MFLYRVFIEVFRFPFLDRDSALRALEAVAQAVTVLLADEPGFAIDDLQGAFSAGGDAHAAAVA
jgi:hypothetical protein